MAWDSEPQDAGAFPTWGSLGQGTLRVVPGLLARCKPAARLLNSTTIISAVDIF